MGDTTPLKLIIGLGNPGPQYADTRHNAGAWLVDALARDAGQTLRPESKFHGLHAKIHWQGRDLHLLNPTTFMNRSGLAVKALAGFFRIQPEEILVAHDELDLAPGVSRFKFGGGHGGHNGLRDLINHLGTRDYYRVRVGIGHPGTREQVVNYVLSNPGKQERNDIDDAIDETLRALPQAAAGDWSAAMNRLHSATGQKR